MTSERLLDVKIEVLYLPKNVYTPKQTSVYAPDINIPNNTPPMQLRFLSASESKLPK